MILAIESSCDESALALFDPARGLVRELVSSQAAEHEKYGGVVPELASRMHLSALPLLLEDFRHQLPQVTQLAVTRGPGLLPCLSMGVTLARSLSLALHLPLVGVNHLRAHVHSSFIAVHAKDPAGFAAARLLEASKRWDQAIKVYEMIAAAGGPGHWHGATNRYLLSD